MSDPHIGGAHSASTLLARWGADLDRRELRASVALILIDREEREAAIVDVGRELARHTERRELLLRLEAVEAERRAFDLASACPSFRFASPSP